MTDTPFSSIPEEMRLYPQWVVWKLTTRAQTGTVIKLPIDPNTGDAARVSDRVTWGTYDQALAAFQTGKYSGMGYVFNEADPFCFIDLDHVINNGDWDPVARDALSNIQSWSEFSQSGDGVHIICKAEGRDAKKIAGVEIYYTGRFVAMTGNHIEGTPADIREANNGVQWLRQYVSDNGGRDVSAPAERPIDQESEAVQRACNVTTFKTGKLEIECPWGHDHSNGDPFGAVYMAAHHNGQSEASFYCQHATCQEAGRSNIGSFRGWLREHDVVYSNALAASAFERIQSANAIDIDQIDAASIPPMPWMYGHRLLRGYLSIYHGPGGTGKSTLALADCLAMASCRNITGVEHNTPYNVMYACNEDDRSVIERRIVALAQYHNINLKECPGRLTLVSGYETPFYMHSSEGGYVDAWVETLKGYDVLVADPMISLHKGLNENSNEDMEQFMATLRTIIKKADVGMMAVAHNRKGSTDGASAEDLRGASAQKDAARITYVTQRMTKKDSEEMGIDWAETGRHLVQVYSGKLNFSPPAAEGDWYKLTGVQLVNGDEVAVPVPIDIEAMTSKEQGVQDPELQEIVRITKTMVLPFIVTTDGDVTIDEVSRNHRAPYKFKNRPIGRDRLRGMLQWAIQTGMLKGEDHGHGPLGGWRIKLDQTGPTDWMGG